jgi:Glyoxalase-like domain
MRTSRDRVGGAHADRDRASPLNCHADVMAIHWSLGCDTAEPQRQAEFWARALSYPQEPGFEDPGNASIIDREGKGPAIGFLRVPEGKMSKNRMHIDIRVAGRGPRTRLSVSGSRIARGGLG